MVASLARLSASSSWLMCPKKLTEPDARALRALADLRGMLIPGPLLVVIELLPRGTSADFMAFMDKRCLPAIRGLVWDDFVQQQDNNTIHVSGYSRRRFAELGVQLIVWPARSPDLNLIENCWSLISSIVYDGEQFDSLSDLWDAIDSAVSHINSHQQDALNNIFGSLAKRFLECVELKGGLTHY